MSLAERLKTRTPRLASLLAVLRALPGGWRKRGTKSLDYVHFEYEIGGSAPGHDLTFALGVRAVLEGRYRVVSEIGAASGSRIVTLKRLFPEIEAYAFDIGESYRNPLERDGVKFRPFDDSALASLPKGTLILSRGTLCYLTAPQIDEFIGLAAQRGQDLVLVEPMPLFDLPQTANRGGSTWYHPYPALLSRHGFKGHADRGDGTKHNGSLGMLECWYASWARAPVKSR